MGPGTGLAPAFLGTSEVVRIFCADHTIQLIDLLWIKTNISEFWLP